MTICENFQEPSHYDTPATTAWNCPICKSKNVTEDHLNSKVHRSASEVADAYLAFCAAERADPHRCSKITVELFLERHGTLLAARHMDFSLAIVAAMHCPVNGTEVNLHPAFRQVTREAIAKAKKAKSEGDFPPSPPSASTSKETAAASPNLGRAAAGAHPYSASLGAGDLASVVRCPNCHQTFDHATYLLLHLSKIHRVSPTSVILKSQAEKRRFKWALHCGFCTKRCASAMAFALHHDTHQVKRFMTCQACRKSYATPHSFYFKDSCGKNNVGDVVKEEVREAIDKLVFQRNVGGVVGAAEESEEEEDEEEQEEEALVRRKDELIEGEKKKQMDLLAKSKAWSDSDDDFLPEDEGEDDDKKKSYKKDEKKDQNDLVSKSKTWDDSDDDFLPERDNEEKEEAGRGTTKAQEEKGKKKPAGSSESYSSSCVRDLMGLLKSSSSNEKLCVVRIPIHEKMMAEEHARITEKERAAVAKALEPVSPAVLEEAESRAAPVEKATPPPPPVVTKKLSVVIPDIRKRTLSSASAASSSPFAAAKRKRSESVVSGASNSSLRSKAGPSSSSGAKERGAAGEDAEDEPLSKKAKKSPRKQEAAATEEKPRPPTPSTSSSSSVSFCLDCEACRSSSCHHRGHPRRVVSGGERGRLEHMSARGHRRFQPAASYLRTGAEVRIPDLAYTQQFGHKVRKKFKAGVGRGDFALAQKLEKKWRCRVKGCAFTTDRGVETFRHIREKHLNSSGAGD